MLIYLFIQSEQSCSGGRNSQNNVTVMELSLNRNTVKCKTSEERLSKGGLYCVTFCEKALRSVLKVGKLPFQNLLTPLHRLAPGLPLNQLLFFSPSLEI